MTTWLERYQQGEHEQVWADLLALGELMQHSDPYAGKSFFYAEALEVARETMRRARHNIELLVARLPSSGYQFGYSWLERLAQDAERRAGEDMPIDEDLYPPEMLEDMRQHPEHYDPLREAKELRRQAQLPPRPFGPPSPEVERRLDELEQLVGPIPLSVRAWYEVVGWVDFVGTCPQAWSSPAGRQAFEHQWEPVDQPTQVDGPTRTPLPGGEATLPIFDPLSVNPIEGVLSLAWGHLGQHWVPLFLDIAPDAFGKYLTSGGGPYGIAVPNGAIDGKLLREPHQTTFVNYLRICFRWAGLPGVRYFTKESGREELKRLTAGLLPL